MSARSMAATLAAIVLAGVFGWSAAQKARDARGRAEGPVELGVPAAAGPIAGVLVTAIEALVALALLLPSTRRFAGIGAVVLLVGFSLAIARQLRLGRRPRCHCFGTRSPGPVGGEALVRNAALGLLAVVVAAA